MGRLQGGTKSRISKRQREVEGREGQVRVQEAMKGAPTPKGISVCVVMRS